MKRSDQGIAEEQMGRKRPADKKPAQPPHPKKSATREATRDPTLSDAEKTPGSGMTPDDDASEAPSG